MEMEGKVTTQVVTRQFYMDVAGIIGAVADDDVREYLISRFGDLFGRRNGFSVDVFRKHVDAVPRMATKDESKRKKK